MNKYGLIGKNISYSFSPKLHKLIGNNSNCELTYELIDIDEEELFNYLKALKERKYQGFNVTIPYKEKIIKHLDILTSQAKKIGAVNTVYLNSDNLLVGDNTDYYGFLKLLEINNVLKDVNTAYILGTGGAAKTIFHVLNDKNIETFNVYRKEDDTFTFKSLMTYLEFSEVKEVPLLINATPVGSILNKGIPIFKSNQTIKKVVDLNYNPLTTELMGLAELSFNGLDMLIYQAIKAQFIFRGIDVINEKELFKSVKEALVNELFR